MATQEMAMKQQSETMVMKKTTVMKSFQSSSSQMSEVHSSNAGSSMEFHQKSSVEQMAMRSVNDQPIEKFHSSRKEELHKIDDKPAITKEELHISSVQGAPVKTQQIMDRTTTQFPKIESTVRPSVPPKFLQPILSAVVQEGDSVVFEGKVEGYPDPSVKWFKNGAEIFRTDVQMTFENTIVRMKIIHTQQSDSGQYTCTARNTSGSASSSADLIVKAHTEPPMFIKRLQARLVKSGEKVSMEIEVTGVPPPEVTWYRNGQLLPKVGKYMLKRDGNVHSLNIQEANTGDTGKFMVKAKNTAGEAQCTADFVVEEPDQPLEIQRITTHQHKSLTEERQQLLTKTQTTTTAVPTQIIKTETVFGEAAPVAPEITPEPGPQVKMEFMVPTSDSFSKTEISMKETKHIETSIRREPSPHPAVLIIEPPPEPTAFAPVRAKSRSPEPMKVTRSPTPIRTFSPVVISETMDSTRRALSPIPYARSPSPMPSISPVRAPSPKLPARPLSPKPPVRAPSPKPVIPLEPLVFKREPSPPPPLIRGPPAQYQFIPPPEPVEEPLPKPGTPPEFGYIAPPPLILPSETKEEPPPPLIKPAMPPTYSFVSPMPPVSMPPVRPMSPIKPVRAPSPVVRPVSPAPMWKPKFVKSPELPPLQMMAPPPPLPKPGSPPEFGFIAPPEPVVEVISTSMTSISTERREFASMSTQSQRLPTPPLEPGPPPEFGFIPPPEQQEIRSITPVMVVEVKRSATPVFKPEEYIVPEPSSEPPLFIKVLHDTTIHENESIKFECVVSGKPLPTEVHWSFNGQPLPVFRRYHTSYLQGVCRLIINEALLADSGVFKCTATNSAGTATTTAQLTVQGMVIQSISPLKPPEAVAPPTFEKLDRNARLVEGGNAIFELVIRGNPPPSVVWTRKGFPIKESQKYLVKYDLPSGICSLLIKQLQREDEGEYTCTAKNPYGEAICTVFIQAQDVVVQQQKRVQETVQYQRHQQFQQHATTSITTQQQQTVQRKGYVHFERRSEQTISGQQIEPPSPVYYTNGTDESFRVDTFEYRLLREIEFRETKTRRLTSETETETDQEIVETSGKQCAPQIEQRLRNSKLLEGCDATFQAKIIGSLRPKITWFKNGQRIVSSQRYQITFKNQIATLYIRMCLPEDAGYYTILVENTIGRVVNSAQLIIEAVGTKDVFSFVRPDRPEDQMDGITRPITPSKIGYVSGSVPADLEDSPTKSLRPNFVKVPTDKEVTEGKMVRFDCRVTGRPYPDVSWYLNGRLVLNDANHKIIVNEAGNHSLLITLTNRNDAGQYTCVARNKGGETSFQVNLIVIEKEQVIAPKFVERFQTMHVREGEPVSLHCRAVGTPIPRVTWQKDGAQVLPTHNIQIQTDGGSSALMFLQALMMDSAWYQCTAQNIAGSTATRARLYVEAEPSFHSEPWRLSLPRPTKVIHPAGSPEREIIWLRHVERARYQRPQEEEDTSIRIAPMFTHPLKDQPNVQEGERVHFEARLVPIGDPTMRIEWYFNGKPLPASSRYLTQYRFGYVTLSILSAYFQDSGTYSCRAINELGEATTNATLTITARPAIELSSQHPQSLEKIQQLEDYGHYQRQVSVEEAVQKPMFVRDLKHVQNVREGQNAHFEAQITPMSDPTMKIEWFFNGQPLQASSRINTIYNFGYIALNIMYIRKEDAGTYVVRATNRVGEAMSTATLTIVDRTEGVTGDTGVTEQQRYVEKIEELESYQKSTSQRFTEEVTIEVAPKFLTELRPQVNIPEGQTAHFEARLEPVGDANMKVIWLKDGKPLEASSRITTFFNFGYVALTIKNIYIHDIGTYTCQATNNKGRAISTSKLTIITSKGVIMDTQHPEGLEKIQHLEDCSRYSRRVLEETMIKQIPKFTVPLKGPSRVPEGKPAHFETRLEPQNDSTMKVEWFLNGKPLQTGHRFKTYFDFGYVALDILYVHPQDTGLFTVKATNNSGVATETCEMTVISKVSIDTSAIHKVGYEKIQKIEDTHFVEPHYDIEEISKSKPVFTVLLKDHSPIAEGGHIHLECRLEPIGDPSMRVEWFFNGRPLTIGSRFKTLHDFGYVALDITHAHAEDTGEYTVRATNHLGSAHTSSCVRVLSLKSVVYESQCPESMHKIQALEDSSRYRRTTQEEEFVTKMPTFTKPLHSLDSVEGSNIHLEARLHPVNDPTMKVEWFFNGRPVKTGHRFRPAHDFDYVALDILSVYAEDSGIYTCKAVNQIGEAVTSASVKIIAKSTLILESQHPEGLEKIQHLEDSSRYQRDTWTEEVVRIPPKFLTKFKNLDLREGQNAHFECRLEPVTDPNLKVEWFRNEKTLTIGHRFRPLHDFGYVALDILGVVSEDTGIYTCRATNIAGSDEMSVQLTCRGSSEIITETQHEESLHKIMHLEGSTRYTREEIQEEVTTQPPVFTSSIKNIEIKEGQRAHFECRLIPVSDPNMKVEWFHNNVPVKSGTRFGETNNFGFVALDILTAYSEDSGTYTCKATNPLGSATTSAVLKCHAKRSIYLETQHEEALEQIQYLEDPTRFSRPSRPDDVHAQPPVFTTPIRNLELLENQSAHFECRLIPTADPNLKVEWFRNNVPLPAANRMSLMHDFGYVALDLSYVHPEDTGTYSCKAINEVGSAVTSATLVVHGKSSLILESQNPEGLQKIQHLEDASRYQRVHYEEHIVTQKPRFITPLTGPTKLFEGQSTHMECRIEPFPDPDLTVEWFFNGKPLQVGHRFRTTFDFGFAALDVLTVYPEDSGEYSIVATNKIGSAKSSLKIFVTGKGSLILETQHPEGLEKIQYLEDESRHRRPAEKDRVFTEKPQFGRGLQNLDRLVEGQSAHLEGTVTPVNDPSMRVEWFFNGRPITQGHRFKTTFDFGYVALDILYVYPEDSGTYMCKASNDVGEAISTCSIYVEAKRSIYSDTLHEEGLKRIQELETVYERPREEVLFVSRPPEFLIPLVSQERLKEGDTLHLESRLEPINDPHMKVEWFINGIEIKTGHRFRTTHDFGYVALDILYIYAEDTGTYMCKATNQLGEAVTTCSIKIQSRKSIYMDTQHPEGWEKIRELENQPKYTPLETPERPICKPFFVTPLVGTTDLLEGQHAHMECRVEPVHDPQLTIEFFHNGRSLVAGARFHVTFDFGYVALDISHVVPEDEGEYTVVVKNDLGEAQSSITIRVQAKSSIISDTHHLEGLEQIRQLEERPLASARSEFVEGHTAQRPVFTVPLQNVDNLIEDEQAHLECRLIPVGDPKLKVEWFFNEKPLQQSSRFKTTHDFGYVALDIEYVRPEDTGFYMCRASNDLGEAVTTCSIKVRSKASIIYDTKHPEGLEKIRRMEDAYAPPASDAAPAAYQKPVFTVALTGPTELPEGQMAHYECRVIPIGDPDLKFDWFINGVELRPSARVRTVHDFGVVTLDVNSVIPEDSGVYMCKASNKAGEAVTSISLKVRGFGGVLTEPLSEEALIQTQKFEDNRRLIPEKIAERIPQAPVFTKQLQSQEKLVEGRNVHLDATVVPINDEKLRIEWYKNGVNLTMGTRIQTMFDFGLVTLDISSIRPDDSGIYTCRAVNEVGEAVSTCTLKVAGYHWLIGSPQHPESLDKIRQLEEPRYQSTYEMEPSFEPPVFISHLNNIECNESDFARFECQVEPAKDPNLKIEFTLNGKALPLATKFTVTNDLGHITLDISHAYPEDSGIYMCRATNRKGQAVTSGSLKVHGKRSIIYDTQHPMGEEGLGRVQDIDADYLSRYQRQFSEGEVGYPKPVFTIPLQPEFSLSEGEGMHLECHVEPAADPRLTVEWFLNGKALEMGSRFRFVHDFGHVVLDVSDMWPRDSGVYTCRAKNAVGEAFTTTTINITGKGVLLEGTLHPKGEEGLEKIQNLEDSLRYMDQPMMDEDGQPPRFTSQFENLTNLTEGDIAHFEASLTPAGDQTMVVEWFYNKESLKAGHRIRTVHAFGMVVLEILGVYVEDTGEYTCRATNKWGRAEITVKLECIDKSRGQKPHFTTQLQCVNLNEGDSAHLECHLIPVGDPKMKVEWFHNEKVLRESSRIKTLSDFGYVVLDISFVESGDVGEYVCRASNQYGEDTTRATVQFLGPGGPNQPPKYTTHIQSLETLVEGQSAHFEATLIPTTDPELKVEWYFNGKKLQHGHRFRTFHDFGVVILDILYCYEEDSGTYEARAVNKFGSDVTRATLKCRSKASLIFDTQLPKEMEGGLEKIQYLEDAMYRSQLEMRFDGKRQPPVFTVPLENVTDLREGENAHLEARLIPVDDPKLKVEWFRNGKPIFSGSRLRTIHDFGFVVLEISPVYPEDSGEYMCRAKNDLGEAVTKCTIQCEGKRGIILETQLPKGMETGVDKIAQLEGYSNAPIPEMWMDLDEANPPRFITQPQDLTLMENSLAHFECRLIPVNDASLRVDWYHNGKPLTAGSRIKTICDFGYVILEIAGVYSRDAGLYTCKATNKHGEASVSCKLSVKSKLGIIMEPQLPSEFKTGTESLQKLEESLYHREERMEEDDQPHPPVFITQIQDLPNLGENEPAHFECRVEPIGDSSMRLEWFHNGRPLEIGSRVHTLDDFGFVVLDIDWTFPRDCGEYICRATNKWGTAMTKANLTCKGKRDIIMDSQLPKGINADKLHQLECPPVHERPAEELPLQPPKFTTQIQPLENMTEGEPAHFECRLIPVNDPKLKVEWFHNGKPLKSGHRFKTTHDFGYVALDILYVHSEDSGEYLAKASNDLGQDTTKTTLTCKSTMNIILYNQIPRELQAKDIVVQMEATLRKYTDEVHLGEGDIYQPEKGQPPKFITQIQDHLDLKEMDSTKFECQLTPVGDPNMKVEWFFNGRPLPFKNRFTPVYDFGYVALDFAWVNYQDCGEYVCRATNKYGSDETRAVLKCSGSSSIVRESQLPKEMEGGMKKIEEMEAAWQRCPREEEELPRAREPPTFVLKLEPCIVEEGQWAKFRCRVTGNPRPRIMWLVNGKTVVTGSRYRLSYDGMFRMDIPKSRQYDAGKVEVIARNSLGEAYCATTLEVRPHLDDYRALLKRSPRPWYDEEVKNYQEERKDLEVVRKFEEHLAPMTSNLYHCDKGTREHLCTRIERDDSELKDVFKKRRLEAQGAYIRPDENLSEEEKEKRLKESITLVQGMAKDYDEIVENIPPTYKKKSKYRTRQRDSKTYVVPTPSESSVHGKEIHTQKQTQTQKEKKGDLEITRKTTVTETVEQEHKGTTKERIVFGKVPESIPPVLTKKIQPCRSYEGESAKFDCEFTGTPTPNVTWYRENFPIKDSKDFQITTTDKMSTLYIREVYMEDSGVFSVIAQNRGGTAKSTSNLVVEERREKPTGPVPPSFLSTAQDVRVKAGQLVRLDAKVSGSKPIDVYWLKNGKKIAMDIRYKTLEEDELYTLLIIEAFPEDIGAYECVAINKSGEARCQAQVHVDAAPVPAPKQTKPEAKGSDKAADKGARAPSVIMDLKDMAVNEGQAAIFRCRLSSQPAPQVKWFRDDNLIKPSRYFRMSHEGDQYVLRISEAFPEDEGTYKFVAENSAGKVNLSAKLKVNVPDASIVPPTVANFRDVVVPEGRPARFVTQVSGTPAPSVQWFREGVLIPQSQDFQMTQDNNQCTLTITTTYPEDSGRYICRATNPSGQAEASAMLRVESKH